MLRFCALIFSLFCLNAIAADYKAVIFGDSLSDEGRLYALTDHEVPSSDYYYEGRFSNGGVWTEFAFTDRENYAYAGAKSDYSNQLEPQLGAIVDDTGLLGQVNEYIAAHPDKNVNDNTVFYISIGANDILSLSTDDEATLKFLISGILQHIKLSMQRLEGAGATHFALVGLPDLAIAPIANDMTQAERKLLTTLSDHFNEGLKIIATRYRAEYIDMDTFVTKVIRRANHYGFTNVTDACFNDETFEICDQPSEYFFWDDKHPTTRVHELFAESLE
ncbi:MAG: SGNH/GDSL hydrolase family protein [Gammaproteobacteria bacterium]